MDAKTIFLSSLRVVKIVVLLTGLNLLVLFIRNYIRHDTDLNFLLNNLFSGFVPLVITYLLLLFNAKLNPYLFWAGALLWVLFYPNSPYMISDLIHNRIDLSHPGERVVYVINTLTIYSIGVLSSFYGFLSLKIIYNLVRARYTVKIANIFIISSLLLSCLGFYMGRSIQGFINNGPNLVPTTQVRTPNLYSIDLFLHPITTIQKVWDRLFPLDHHRDAYFMMVLFALIQFSLLLMMKTIQDFQSSDRILNEVNQSTKTSL